MTAVTIVKSASTQHNLINDQVSIIGRPRSAQKNIPHLNTRIFHKNNLINTHSHTTKGIEVSRLNDRDMHFDP